LVEEEYNSSKIVEKLERMYEEKRRMLKTIEGNKRFSTFCVCSNCLKNKPGLELVKKKYIEKGCSSKNKDKIEINEDEE
jgi:hypothetical protein